MSNNSELKKFKHPTVQLREVIVGGNLVLQQLHEVRYADGTKDKPEWVDKFSIPIPANQNGQEYPIPALDSNIDPS